MEMEVEFKREMNRSYMVLKQENTGTGRHAVQMMTKNRIPGLLPFQEKRVDGDCRYYYDITSRQPLARLLEYRGLSGAELRRLIGDILLVLRQMERYLLDESQLCLEPDMIYMEPAGSQSSLCLIPGRKVPFAIEFCELSQYLLDHIDHNDGEAVILAFAIFKESRKENFGIEDIEACLGQAGKVEAAPLRKREEDSGFLEEKLEEKKGKERKREEAGRPGAGRTEAGRPENGRSGKERSKTKKAETKKPEAERPKVEKVKTERLGAGRLEGRAKAIWLLPLCAIGTPLLLWAFGGIELLFRCKWLLGAGIFLLISGAVLFQERNQMKAAVRGMHSAEEEEWDVFFSEEPMEMDWSQEILEEGGSDIRAADGREREEDIQTILLTGDVKSPELRRLVPVKGGEEIAIRYFPFLIGKSRDIADYCIELPEVSRLHLKLEKIGSGYAVTDLNSTNGTYVNGYLLTANETYPLVPGDELSVAAVKFKFL